MSLVNPMFIKSTMKLPTRGICAWIDNAGGVVYIARVGNVFDYYLKSLSQMRYGTFKNEHIQANVSGLEFRVLETLASSFFEPYQIYRHQHWHMYFKGRDFKVVSAYPEQTLTLQMDPVTDGYKLSLLVNGTLHHYKTYANPEQWKKIGKLLSVETVVERLNGTYKPEDLPTFTESE